MTVAHVIPSVNQYNGDSTTDTFNFTFQVLNTSSDLFVYFIVNTVPLQQTTGYTVTLNTPNTLPSTGYITFITPPPIGTIVRLSRNTYEQRLTNYVTGPIQPATLNADIDNTVLMIQDVTSQLIPQDGAGNYQLGGALMRNLGTPLLTNDAATLGSVTSAVAASINLITLPQGWINANAPAYGLSTSKTGAQNRIALQAAINAASLLGTFVTASNGTYAITGTITNSTALNFMGIRGTSTNLLVFNFIANTIGQDAMVFTDMPNGYMFDNFTVNGPGQSASGTISGFKLPLSGNPVTIGSMSNVVVSNFPTYGFYYKTVITSTFTDLEALLIGTTGFYINGGTSMSFNNCYANNVKNIGYFFVNVVYSSLNSCAADNCNDAYYLQGTSGIVLNGCGNESNVYISGSFPGRGVVVDGSTAIQVNGQWCYDLPNIASIGYHLINGVENSTFISCTNLQYRVLVTWDAVIDSGAGNSFINLTAQGRAPADFGLVNDLGNINSVINGSTILSSQAIKIVAPQVSINGVGQTDFIIDANINPDGTDSGGTSESILSLYVNTDVSLNKTGWQLAADPGSGNLFIFNTVAGVTNQAGSVNADGSFLSMLTADQGSGLLFLGDGADAGGICSFNYTGSTGILAVSSSGGVSFENSGGTTVIDSTNSITGINKISSIGSIGVNGATPPTQVTGFGTPTGNVVVNNFPGASATLVQTSNTVAEILIILKAAGFIGA